MSSTTAHDVSSTSEGDGSRRGERNRLLRALPDEEYALLAPHMERRVCEEVFTVLTPANEPYSHVYFPEVGVISIVNEMADGAMVEAGTVGSEGMAGLPVLLDAESWPSVTMIQIPGEIVQIPTPVMVDLVARRPALRRVLNRYAQAFMIQVAQTAACNRAHDIGARCARWLCMTHDRMGGADQFLLTQGVLAQMLGVRRAGVTVAAGALQKAGLIRYSRGKITVLDRAGLERASCECYGVVAAHFDRLLGDEERPRPA